MTKKIRFTMLPAALLLVSSAAHAELTIADVKEMKYKVDMATKFFQATWRDVFSQAGKNYPAPGMVPFVNQTQSVGCGLLKGPNAMYCPKDNTIYYDVVFLTAEMKATAAARGTDGDYAPIVILAHEMGHAVAHLLDANKFALKYSRERLADCLAGVVTSYAKRAGNLEAGDLEEGVYELGRGGDDPKTSILSPHAHGPAEARQKAFRLGYESGIHACDAGLGKTLAVGAPAPATKPWERNFGR